MCFYRSANISHQPREVEQPAYHEFVYESPRHKANMTDGGDGDKR